MEAIKQQDKPEASVSHPQPLASTDLAKPKKVKPPHCFRCKCNGHLADCFKADLDCFICNKKNAHISAKCPLVKLPKPTASMLGFAKNELGFFHIPNFEHKLPQNLLLLL